MTEDQKAAHLATVKADLLAMPVATLVERLRGIYRTPVNDGAGPLNGSYEHVRQFETVPIQHAAADLIDRLTAEQAAAVAALKAALPQAEVCWVNHYGDNPEGGAVPQHIQMMRDAIARVEGRTP